MYARTQNGTVTQWPLSETHIRNRGIPPEEARPIQPSPKPDFSPITHCLVERKPTVVDGEPVQVWEVLPHADARQRAKAAMIAWIDALTAQVMSQYPAAVQARWPIEEAAARAVKAGTATQDQTDLVTNEGLAKGRNAAEQADAIIANADRFKAIANEINKLFLAADKSLLDATDPAQYAAILEGAKLQAAPLAEAYGLAI